MGGPGGRQIQVGQRRGVLAVGVGGGEEDGIEGAGLGAPGDRDVVSGGFAEAVQLFGGGGVRRSAVAWASASARGQPGGQGVFDVDVGDQSGAGNVGDADGGGTLGRSTGCAARPGPRIGSTPSWVRRPASAPVWAFCGW